LCLSSKKERSKEVLLIELRHQVQLQAFCWFSMKELKNLQWKTWWKKRYITKQINHSFCRFIFIVCFKIFDNLRDNWMCMIDF
jgi:hypothetical protein